MGRIQVIKCLVELVHLSVSFPSPTPEMINHLNKTVIPLYGMEIQKRYLELCDYSDYSDYSANGLKITHRNV